MDNTTSPAAPAVPATPEMTFGEKLVGKTFNPSQDPRVDRLKQLAAEMADIVNDIGAGKESSHLSNMIKGGALRRILDAQMWAVKHATFRD